MNTHGHMTGGVLSLSGLGRVASHHFTHCPKVVWGRLICLVFRAKSLHLRSPQMLGRERSNRSIAMKTHNRGLTAWSPCRDVVQAAAFVALSSRCPLKSATQTVSRLLRRAE